MKIYLLTHERELQRKTNTGQLVLEVLGTRAERVLWQRRHPDPGLLQLAKENRLALIYPVGEGECVSLDAVENSVLIDATWQEANKIYNRSPYLQALPKIKIEAAHGSSYGLRRNQKKHGLCTAECVIELLGMSRRVGETEQLQDHQRQHQQRLQQQKLQQAFDLFNRKGVL